MPTLLLLQQLVQMGLPALVPLLGAPAHEGLSAWRPIPAAPIIAMLPAGNVFATGAVWCAPFDIPLPGLSISFAGQWGSNPSPAGLSWQWQGAVYKQGTLTSGMDYNSLNVKPCDDPAWSKNWRPLKPSSFGPDSVDSDLAGAPCAFSNNAFLTDNSQYVTTDDSLGNNKFCGANMGTLTVDQCCLGPGERLLATPLAAEHVPCSAWCHAC